MKGPPAMHRPLLALLLAPLCACNGNPAAPQVDGGDGGAVTVGPENVVRVKEDTIEVGPRLAGSLEPREQARVRAELTGTVLEVKVELGETVKAGQLLARIEDRAARDAFHSAQSALRASSHEVTLAQRQLERTERLVKAGALAERELETAQLEASAVEARRDQARAQLAQARTQLDATTVTAPMDGVVSERAVNAGDVVSPGAPLFTVIDPSSMRLTAAAPSEAIGRLAVGRPVSFTVRGYGDQRFTGTIEHISPAVDPVTRQLTVLVDIPNPDQRLVAGLFAEGRVAFEQRRALVVPTSAVEQGDPPHVARVTGGRVERVNVTLGLDDEQTERVEVTAGLSAGDLLLVGPARSLSSGTPIQVSTQPSSGERG